MLKICLINGFISWQKLTFVNDKNWLCLRVYAISSLYYQREHRFSVKLISDHFFPSLEVFIVTLFFLFPVSISASGRRSIFSKLSSSVREECTFLSCVVLMRIKFCQKIFIIGSGTLTGITITNTIYYNCYL